MPKKSNILEAVPMPAPVSRETSEPVSAPTLRLVRVDAIESNPWQPRKTFDPGEMESLAESIREKGLLQPPVVREEPTWEPGKMYQLIAGERRVRASKLAGIEEIQVLVRVATDQQMAELAIVENRDRADVNPIEEANAYARLVREFGVKVADVAEAAGKGRSVVSNSLRLLSLPESVQALVARGALSVTHARALAKWAAFPGFVAWYAPIIVQKRVPSKGVEAGFVYSAPEYEARQRAQADGIYASASFDHRNDSGVASWVQQYPDAFVPMVWERREGSGDWADAGYICLDVDLMARLKAEVDAAKRAKAVEEGIKAGRSPAVAAAYADSKAEADKLARRQVLAENKAQREKICRRAAACLSVLDKARSGEADSGREEGAVFLLAALDVFKGSGDEIQTIFDRRSVSLQAKSIFKGTVKESLPALLKACHGKRTSVDPVEVLLCAVESLLLHQLARASRDASNWTPEARGLLAALGIDEAQFEPVDRKALEAGGQGRTLACERDVSEPGDLAEMADEGDD